MKKYFISLVLFGLLVPLSSFALVEDVDPNPNTSSCVSLNYNLRYQSRDINTNGEVSTLQDFLQSQGYLNSEPTGYLGLLTVAAAKSFQSANGISPTGYVGPLTRAKIATVTCGGTTTPPPTIPSRPDPCPKGAVFSSENGKPCNTNLPPGCWSTSGYSSTTGMPCGKTDYPKPNVEVKSNNGEKTVNVNKGELVYVTWESKNTFSCAAVGSSWDHSQLSDKLVTNGYITVVADESAEYTISCEGFTKTVSDSMKINVESTSTCSDSGYDTRTGFRCGCTTNSGFSSTTGEPCGGDNQSLEITTGSRLPNAEVGENYSIELKTSGGSGSNFWQVNNGAAAFPVTGLGLSSSYGDSIYIKGVPAKIYWNGVESKDENTFSFTVNVTSGSVSTSKTFTLTVESDVDEGSYPQGCSSASGWSTTTGQSCDRDLLDGCKSFSGWSSTTGESCEI